MAHHNHRPSHPWVIIEVSGGIAQYWTSRRIVVGHVDWDSLKEGETTASDVQDLHDGLSRTLPDSRLKRDLLQRLQEEVDQKQLHEQRARRDSLESAFDRGLL